MPLSGEEYEVVGLSVAGDGPVRSIVHLQLDASVQALYGLNGAGKSRILKLASAALTGVAPVASGRSKDSPIADLHIRVTDTGRPPFDEFTEHLARRLSETVTERQGSLAQRAFSDALEVPEMQELIERHSTDDIWTHLAALIQLADVDDQLPAGLAAQLNEAAYSGLLTLRAAGTPDRPAWDVYLSLSIAEEGVRDRCLAASAAWRQLQAIAELEESDEQGRQLKAWMHELGKTGIPALAPAGAYWGRGRAQDSTRPTSWPDWLQLPALLVAEKIQTWPVHVVGTRGGHAVDQWTLERLLQLAPSGLKGGAKSSLVTALQDGVPTLNADLQQSMEQIQRHANDFTEAVLLDPPSLRFQLGVPDQWLSGRMPRWEYQERWTGEWLPIDQLSSARERWVRLAIELATAPVDEVPAVFICDEPERGLHRLAEGRLGQGLPVLARTRPFGVLAATHSPALLNSKEIRPLLVSRTDASGAQVRPASISLVDRVATETTAHQLGMSVGDLWPLSRVIVVVEGLHDEAVFASLLREPLDAAPAGLYAIHGGTKLKSLAEPGLMINATNAQILVVLDELHSSLVDPLWSQIQQLVSTGAFDEAREAIAALRKQDGDSFLFLHQFAFRALENGCLDRVHVYGLSLPDVICYLRESDVLMKPEPWDSLIQRWRDDAAPERASNIKKWLKKRGALPTDEKALDNLVVDAAHCAARDGVPVHRDLLRLGARICELATQS